MDIKSYLKHEKINLLQFAQRLGYSYSYLRSVLNGSTSPSERIVRHILHSTAGKIDLRRHLNRAHIQKMAEREWLEMQQQVRDEWIARRIKEIETDKK